MAKSNIIPLENGTLLSRNTLLSKHLLLPSTRTSGSETTEEYWQFIPLLTARILQYRVNPMKNVTTSYGVQHITQDTYSSKTSAAAAEVLLNFHGDNPVDIIPDACFNFVYGHQCWEWDGWRYLPLFIKSNYWPENLPSKNLICGFQSRSYCIRK